MIGGRYGIYASGIDADARIYLEVAGIADWTNRYAASEYFKMRKDVAPLSAVIASYGCLGGTFDAMKYNLFNPQDTDAAKRWIAGGGAATYAATGIKGNGTSSFINTKIKPTDFTGTDFTIAIYSRTNQIRQEIELGSLNSGFGGFQFNLQHTDNRMYVIPLGSVISQLVSGIRTDGCFILKRSVNTVTVKRNDVIIFNQTFSGTNNKPNFDMYFMARNYNGTAEIFSNKEYSHLEAIDGALSAEQETALYNAILNKETILGRNV